MGSADRLADRGRSTGNGWPPCLGRRELQFVEPRVQARLRVAALDHAHALTALLAVLLMPLLTWAPVVHAADIVLFQPGQSSWEWLLVPASHDGGKRMREGKSCLYCHEGEAKVIGDLIVSGEKLEPNPIASMPGFVEMAVRHHEKAIGALDGVTFEGRVLSVRLAR